MLRRVGSDDPVSYRTLKPGTDVISSDGDRVGVVEHVLADEESDIFDGIVIDVRLGPGGLRFVDAPQVAELRESAAVLAVSTTEVEQLPKPEPNPAVMEQHGVEDSESPLEHKLRRAWEIVSGKG
jgi:PRC-barrel domain